MKLAEALLQDKPIKRKGFKMWCKPEIVKSNLPHCAALPTVCGTDKYTLCDRNMTADDWEIKQAPMKFEFECVWRKNAVGTLYPEAIVEIGMFDKMVDSGKSFKVTCEEVEG